jgi:hypothetical protein
MVTSVAHADHAAPFPMFAMPPGEKLADTTFAPMGASFGPVCIQDGQAVASVGAHAHARFDREKIVNRLLDWAEEAREQGRARRADYLVCLAWDAYDRVPG